MFHRPADPPSASRQRKIMPGEIAMAMDALNTKGMVGVLETGWRIGVAHWMACMLGKRVVRAENARLTRKSK